jgi:hypothetical protein
LRTIRLNISSHSNWLYDGEKRNSSISLRRESLYPAELSGLEGQIVELFARGIEVL